MIGLSWMRSKVREALGAGVGAIAGVGFMVLAGIAIQFEEGVGPKLADFGASASDFSRKLFSL